MNKQKSASNPGNPFDRALPNNPAAEKSVIGALIRDPAKIGVIQGSIGLEASDFYTPNHQIIFQTILDLFSEKLPIDLMLLAERLEKNDSLEKVGGAYYLMDVANSSATSANAEYYAAIVKEKSLRRLLLRDNWDIAQNAHNEDLDLLTLRIQELSKKVTNPLGRSQRPILLGDCFEKVISDTQEALERLDQKGVLRKYATGLIALDRIMGGFNPGQMVITAARPSEGKSALLCTFMSYAAAHYGPALLFPLEMTVEEMAARYLYSSADFPFNTAVSKDQVANLFSFANRLKAIPFYADPTPRLTIMEICRRAELFTAEHGTPSMVGIDYLTLIEEPHQPGKRDDYRLNIVNITRECKLLAKTLNTVVLLICQFNREIEKGPWRKPRLSDLRESGSIEQDADIVIFPYREETVELNAAGRRWLMVSKNRNGPTGEVPVYFNPASTRFDDLSFNGDVPPPYQDKEIEPW